MNKQRFFIFLTTVIIVIALALAWINKPHPNIHSATTVTITRADFLTELYLENEETANHNFKEKVIEVTGVVKQINFLNQRKNIILKGTNNNTSVLCDLESEPKNNLSKLKVGQQIKIKGMCKGFLKDVILLNCMLVNTQNNEEN